MQRLHGCVSHVRRIKIYCCSIKTVMQECSFNLPDDTASGWGSHLDDERRLPSGESHGYY